MSGDGVAMEMEVSLATPLQPAVRLGEKGGRLQAPLTLAFPAELPKAQTFADMKAGRGVSWPLAPVWQEGMPKGNSIWGDEKSGGFGEKHELGKHSFSCLGEEGSSQSPLAPHHLREVARWTEHPPNQVWEPSGGSQPHVTSQCICGDIVHEGERALGPAPKLSQGTPKAGALCPDRLQRQGAGSGGTLGSFPAGQKPCMHRDTQEGPPSLPP